MAWVIIILVVLVWWFWSSNLDTKEDLKILESKIANFDILVRSVEQLDGYFQKTYKEYNRVTLWQYKTEISSKCIDIQPSNGKLNIQICLKDYNSKYHFKNLSYVLPINQANIADTIKAEFLYFENNLLKNNPNFYGLQNKAM